MANNNRISNISIEGAKMIFRNLRGEPDQFDRVGGKHKFSILLDEESAMRLKADGWNVKPLKSRDEDDVPHYHLPVEASYKNYPPKIWLIAGKQKTQLTEETISSIDFAELDNVDIVIQPYVWDVNGKTGVKAYVKNMYVTIVEDEFEKKYRDLDDSDVGEEDTPF